MIRLTTYAAKGGCACKLGPHILDGVLKGIQVPTRPEVMINMEGADDAGVYRLTEDMAMVQTVDFFTPLVDDPYTFGKIAAANSLSDVYAMGGIPVSAMNIVAFPVPLVEQGALNEVLRGASEILTEANVALLGGHSIEDDVPKFGMAVTGLIHPDKIWANGGAQPGDALVLTKPLGTGIMSTALKGDMFLPGGEEAIRSMSTLNRAACEAAQRFSVHACTDVTGFSLMGHGSEMAKESNASLHIEAASLPLFQDVPEAAAMGLVPAATYGNRKAITNIFFDEALEPVWQDICFDPQTSGGLLLAVPSEEAEALCEALHKAGADRAAVIGQVSERKEFDIYVR